MKKIIKKYCLILFWLINYDVLAQSAWYFTPADVNALHKEDADFRIPYGKDKLQFADLRIPKDSHAHPVAIIIHGGCWLSTFADLSNTSALAEALRQIGFATWNIEYRRADNEGGGWPGTFKDLALATDFLRKISSKYSLDLKRVIVIGHSAGGHLALWLASRHHLKPNSQLYTPKPLPLRGVIVLGGVSDLKAFREQGKKVCGADVVAELLGKNRIASRYKETSPIDLLPLGIRQIFIYGVEDKVVPYKLFEDYLSRAKQLGDPIKLIPVKYAGHHEYNVPNSVTWPVIKLNAESLITRF